MGNDIGIRLYDSFSNKILNNTFSGNREDIDIQYRVDEYAYILDIIIVSIILYLSILTVISVIFIMDKRVFRYRAEEPPPVFGITSLIFDLIGLIFLALSFRPFWTFYIIYGTPFLIAGIICGYAGYKLNKDITPRLANLGYLLGILFLFSSIFPFITGFY